MSNNVIFHMDEFNRARLVESHQFYVREAKKRLLCHFDNIKEEALLHAQAWLGANHHCFNPERDDAGDFHTSAYEQGAALYFLLSDMRDRTRLSVVSGMYHEWDKQLREWLVDEVKSWYFGDKLINQIWKSDISLLFDLLVTMGFDIRSKPYFKSLDACRLVVNVYKHGAGTSFDSLKVNYPTFLHISATSSSSDIHHEDVNVDDRQFSEISDAIVSFWADVPEKVTKSQFATFPQWFQRAFAADNTPRKKVFS
jgi:hypothetical protein